MPRRKQLVKEVEAHELGTPLAGLWASGRHIQKARIANGNRKDAFERLGRIPDTYTVELTQRIQEMETWIDNSMLELLQQHPVWPWASRIKGLPKETLAKVVALFDIEAAPFPSSFWRYAGLDVLEDGTTRRPERGQKLTYNAELRAILWWVGTVLKMSGGPYYETYMERKNYLTNRYLEGGWRILPTPPKKSPEDKRIEPPMTIWLGHLNNQAVRWMIKLFVSHLWTVWREGAGLPLAEPYAQTLDGHRDGYIDPWTMVEK